jgi:hypothetical protein
MPLVIDPRRLNMRGDLGASVKEACYNSFRFVCNRMSFDRTQVDRHEPDVVDNREGPASFR